MAGELRLVGITSYIRANLSLFLGTSNGTVGRNLGLQMYTADGFVTRLIFVRHGCLTLGI